MASILRSCKSGSDWTRNDLRPCNVVIQDQPLAVFLVSPPDSGRWGTFEQHRMSPNASKQSRLRVFFRYLTDAWQRSAGTIPTENAVNDFAHHLLTLMDFDEPNRVIHRHSEVSFNMGATTALAKPDLSVLDEEDYILLVQEDTVWLKAGLLNLLLTRRLKQLNTSDDAKPQLIAQAIASFHSTNRRRHLMGIPELERKHFLVSY